MDFLVYEILRDGSEVSIARFCSRESADLFCLRFPASRRIRIKEVM